MSMVEDYGEWVWAFEMEFYSFSYRFSDGFRLSHSMSLKMSFLLFALILNVRSLIFSFFFFSGEKRRKCIILLAEEEMNGKS